MSDEVCVFCRVGSCGIHAVYGFKAIPGLKTDGPDDDRMVEVGCCDSMQAAVNHGLFYMHRRQLVMKAKGVLWAIKRCPFCEEG